MKSKLTLIASLLILLSCKNVSSISTVKNNVCKSLVKETLVFAVFVDSKGTHPWTEYDINSTLDSLKRACHWLEDQADKAGKTLNIQLEYARNIKKNCIPFREEFKYDGLSATLFKYRRLSKGIALVDNWSDNISKDVARSLPDDDSELILTENRSNSRERLIAKLRNQYKTDNVAVLFFINNYFENELSVALHTGSNSETEYAVVSTKNPAVIAHETLHLFGALDLYITHFESSLFERRRKRAAMRKFPNEIMAFTHRDIDSLELSPASRYLIGWQNNLSKKEARILVSRAKKLINY